MNNTTAPDKKLGSMVPLKKYVEGLDDDDIISYVSKYKSTSIYQRNDAANETMTKMEDEWKTRHGEKPIPRVMTEKEMIIAEKLQ